MGMKLGKTVLVEIMSILQLGLSKGTDVSQCLRDIRVDVSPEDTGSVELAPEYQPVGRKKTGSA
jgi:hypothetical protein